MNNKPTDYREIWENLRPKIIAALKVMVFGLSLTAILALGFYYSVLYGAFGEIPAEDDLRNIQNAVATEIYSSDNVLMGKYYLENRTIVKFIDISPYAVNALIATEDARFFRHEGVDTRSLFRVLIKSILLRDDSAGGGSTISQQLIKNLFPRKNHGFLTMPVNKTREAIIAGRLEKVYNKNDVLTLYLNTVSFGEDVFGIDAASRRFFSKSPAKLDAEQAATLIGMLKAPTSYNPRINPEKSLSRRNVVLDQMSKYNYLTKAKTEEFKKKPLGLKYNRESASDGLAPHFREQLRLELKDWCKTHLKPDGKPYNLYTDGLKVYTTIDSRMQTIAQNSVSKNMSDLQKSFQNHWKTKKPWGSNQEYIVQAKKQSARYLNLKSQGLTEAEIDKVFKTKVPMRLFEWESGKPGIVEKNLSPLDSIIYYQMFLNTGFMVMEASTGQVKAWVGSISHRDFQFDHTKAKRQVGSTFKPIVYATAIENNMPPCNYFPNELRTYEDYQNWTPQNSDEKYGGFYSMSGALTSSVNTVSVQIILETGVNEVLKIAKLAGINSQIPSMPSIALGAADISLQEMMSAYSIFPNKGYSVKPVYLNKITDRNGRILQAFTVSGEKTKVISAETAALMLEMLQEVVNDGTAQRIRNKYNINSAVGGKTGTTQNQTDGWFMGITPKYVAGAWVGGSNRLIRFNSISLGQGANTALPIWAEFFRQLYEHKDYKFLIYEDFPNLPEYLSGLLDCPPYVENLWEIPTNIEAEDNNNEFEISPNGEYILKPKQKVTPPPPGQTVNGQKPDEKTKTNNEKDNPPQKRRSFFEKMKDVFEKD
ncbi:MAG: transglycosylase domain-containing protein [Sphingobacteriales bacterium]|nr:MAG: transglycosylase domain-containing protein [Sphingobacteriales bacterium]